MKMLSTIAPKLEDGDIVIQMKVVTKPIQTALIDLSVDQDTLAKKMAIVDYVCCNCIDTLTINGDSYNPNELCEQADLADDDTFNCLMKISAMVIESAFMGKVEAKK